MNTPISQYLTLLSSVVKLPRPLALGLSPKILESSYNKRFNRDGFIAHKTEQNNIISRLESINIIVPVKIRSSAFCSPLN